MGMILVNRQELEEFRIQLEEACKVGDWTLVKKTLNSLSQCLDRKGDLKQYLVRGEFRTPVAGNFLEKIIIVNRKGKKVRVLGQKSSKNLIVGSKLKGIKISTNNIVKEVGLRK